MTLVSVLVTVHNPDPTELDATISSVVTQTYGGWELCVVDDSSTDPAIGKLLKTWTARDPRIRSHRRNRRGGPSQAAEDALAMANGDVVTLLGDRDLLHPEALSRVNHVYFVYPDVDVVYTDEDTVDQDDVHDRPSRKPGWSPEYLNAFMYLGHLVAYRTSLARSVGGFAGAPDEARDWDLALRGTEGARGVHHVHEVLYHRRVSSAAVETLTPRVGRTALEQMLARRGRNAVIEESAVPGWFHVRNRLTPAPPLTAVVPTAGSMAGEDVMPYRLVDRCLEGLLSHTDYPDLQVQVVVSANAPEHLEHELPERFGTRVQTVRLDGAFNYSTSINLGVLQTSTPYLLLLNDDTEPISADWLRRMVEVATDPEVGVVGAKLLYPGGTVQHAGVTHSAEGQPHHPHMGLPDGPGYLGDLLLSVNYLAVTGACQVTRRAIFDEVGGYDPHFPLNFNDIDFCLRVGARGYRVVQQNAAALVHHESVSRVRGVHTSEIALFHERWAHLTRHDPYRRMIARVG